MYQGGKRKIPFPKLCLHRTTVNTGPSYNGSNPSRGFCPGVSQCRDINEQA